MEQFTFYRYWLEAVEGRSAEERLEFYESIFAQAFGGKPINAGRDIALKFISNELRLQDREQTTQKRRSAAAKKSATERWNKSVSSSFSPEKYANASFTSMRTHNSQVCERITAGDANASKSGVIHKVIHKQGENDANAYSEEMRSHTSQVCERILPPNEPQHVATLLQRSATVLPPLCTSTVPNVRTINNNNNNKRTDLTVREHDTCKDDGKAREQMSCASFPFFDKFWASFPDTIDKTERNRGIAFNVWRSTKAEEAGERVLDALKLSAARWDNPRYIPLPQNWLIKMPWTANLEAARVRAETGQIPAEPDESEADVNLAIERLLSGKHAGVWNNLNEERLQELRAKKAVWMAIRAAKAAKPK